MGAVRKLLVVGVVFLLTSMVLVNTTVAVDDHLDKTCASHTDLVPLGGALAYQTFTAGYDRISRYGFYLSGSGSIDLGIRRATDDFLLVQRTINYDEERFYTMTIVNPIEVTIGESYEIYARASTPDQIMGFNSDGGCFAGSNANVNGFDGTADTHFAVYGYNQSELDATPTPAPEDETATATPEGAPVDSTDSEQNTSGSTSESDNSSEPSNEPSATIGKATDVKVKFDAKSKAVSLTWKKSPTAEIDGYKIFRSEEKTKGLKQIGKTDEKILEYTDKIISQNKTYYYFIRAYAGTEESFSSETVKVDIPVFQVKTSITPTTSAATQENNWFTDNLPYTIPGLVVILGGLGFLFWKFVLPKIRARLASKS